MIATFLKRVADLRFKMSVNLQRKQSVSMYHHNLKHSHIKNRLYSTTDGVKTGDEQCINWTYRRKKLLSIATTVTIAKTIATAAMTNNTLDFYCVALFKKLSALI